MTPLVQVERLLVDARNARGIDVSVLDGVDLAINPGEIVAAIGASGSGKSTLGLALAGYARPGMRFVSGRVIFDNQDVLALPAQGLRLMRGRDIAFVPQSAAAAFNPALTINKQVIESSVIRGTLGRREAERSAQTLYANLGLPDPQSFGERYPHQVSGGQLQRAAAAMAFAGMPKLVVFDEPTTSLDVTTQVGVLAVIRDYIRARKIAAFYISHDLAVVAQLADRIVVMSQGRVIDEGSVEAILGRRGGAVRGWRGPDVKALTATPLLAIRNLSVHYDRQKAPALADVSFDIRKGEVVGLIGESGSGKSTLARSIAGLLKYQTGAMEFDGHPLPPAIRQRARPLRGRIQIAFQSADLALNPRHKVRDIIGRPISMFRPLKGREHTREIGRLLDLVELPQDMADRFPGQLSGGQKQRVNLARALAAEPDLVICDEVTSALDEPLRDAIIDLLRRLKTERGLAFLFVTHDLSTVSDFADRVMVLYRGRLVEEGSSASILEQPQHPYTAELVRSIPRPDPGWLDAAVAASRSQNLILRPRRPEDMQSLPGNDPLVYRDAL